jgi:hypothetical protein
MKRLILTIVLVALIATPALGSVTIGPPPQVRWDRGDPGTTWKEFYFNDNDNPAAPEAYYNPYVDPPEYPAPFADLSADNLNWYSGFEGHNGVWIGHDVLRVEIYNPDRPEPLPFKEVWVRLSYRGDLTDYTVSPDNGQAIDPLYFDPGDLTAKWKIATIGWRIMPNPPAELICLNIEDSGGGIDWVTADTICIPEPATICLLGFGALSLIRRKRSV